MTKQQTIKANKLRLACPYNTKQVVAYSRWMSLVGAYGGMTEQQLRERLAAKEIESAQSWMNQSTGTQEALDFEVKTIKQIIALLFYGAH